MFNFNFSVKDWYRATFTYIEPAAGFIAILRDFVEISDVTYQKLDEIKVVTQLVKMIRTLNPFKPKI